MGTFGKSGNLNATVAKMHAVFGHRLKQEDYAALIGCTSVAEAAGYLKKTQAYGSILEGVDTETVHRGNLEDILKRGFYENYFRMVNFQKIGNSEFYNYISVKTEIDEILICITHINAGTTDHITTLPIYMNRYTSFDLMELAHVRTYEQLLQLVEKTPYFDILAETAPPKKEDGTFGHIDYGLCELKLRTYYAGRLISSVESFPEASRDKLRSYIGSQLDMINIINAYRMTKYFHAGDEVIKKRMIPIYLNISEKKMDELYAAEDEKVFIERLGQTYHGRQIAALGLDMSDPESALLRFRYRQTLRAFRMAFNAPECFFTYNTLRELEVKNIIRVIEGIRYSLPAKEISELLIIHD